MEYLEDCISEELIDQLDIELKKIYDNEEFALCILSGLENDNEAIKMLNFLKSNDISEEQRYKVILFHSQIEKERIQN